MTRDELIRQLSVAIAREEGFFVTKEQALAARMKWPTIGQENGNPGNIRLWADRAGKPYPRRNGFVDFAAWAENKEAGAAEGWRVLGVLVGRYVDGKYHGGQSPTLLEMFAKYAPSSDGNDPNRYARHVSRETRIPLDCPLASMVDA